MVRRIASLVPSLTHTVCALGAGDRLVARTIYCVEPRDALAAVPACGGTKNPDLERILALQAEIALCCDEENKPEHRHALASAGVTVHTVMPRSLDDVDALLCAYGDLLGVRAAAAEARAELAAARQACAGRLAGRAAALIWKDPWMAVGGGCHGDGLMRELGLANVFADRPGYPAVTLDELAALDLDLLLLPDEPWRFTPADAARLADAGLARRAVAFDGKDLSWYGAWTAGGLRRLAALLQL